MKLCRSLAVLAFLSAIPANADADPAEPAPEATKNEKPAETTVIGLWVDQSLDLISENAFIDRIKTLGIDFKSALEKETDAMTGNLYGVRAVTGKQFAALIDKVTDKDTEFSSFYSYTVIGTTHKRACLEATIPLSKFSYVAIVSAPLEDLPAKTLEKVLAHRQH